MGSEKRVLLAAALSAIFISVYSSAVLKPSRQPAQQLLPVASPQTMSADVASYHILDEDVTVIESRDVRLEIGKSSAAVRKVTLKQFHDSISSAPLQISSSYPLLGIRGDVRWILKETGSTAVTFTGADASASYRLTYELNAEQPGLQLSVATDQATLASLRIIASWAKADALNDQQNRLEISARSEDNGKARYFRHGVSRKAKNVPRGTLLLSIAERFFCISVKSVQPLAVQILPSINGHELVTEASLPSGADTYQAKVYFGPRDYFYLRQAGVEQAFAVGTISQIGLVLLSFLKWIAGITKNYGVAIICFSIGITALISPLTLISFRSMKKMQELKPKVDHVLAKYKNDQMKANQEVFALYREHKVSPLSGCLPMLLQMPILIALFQAMSHFIDFRGKGFLWIADLSLPDHFLRLPFSVPLLGPHLNLLPIIMAAAMYIQTRQSSRAMGSAESNPTAKMFSGPLMPIMFGVMFYQVPSGLVLYWLTNTLMSLVIYRVAKS
ncbi:MAG: membrane protein insertase YidC [Candidatus Omnitrophica bacterium]|nr:membrane protein insertase YidC [Candidatus Omnitrophota bacterium]